jgi:hypothetical protein
MWARYLIVIGLIALLPMSLSCAGTPELDRNSGRSFETAKTNQILNLDAQKNLEPVVGRDGQVAVMSMETYMGSFAPAEGEKAVTLKFGGPNSVGSAK